MFDVLPDDIIEYIIDLKNRAEHKENMSKVNKEFNDINNIIDEYRIFHIEPNTEPLLILADETEFDCFLGEYYNPEFDIITKINRLNIENVVEDKYERFYTNKIPDEFNLYLFPHLFT